MRLKYYLLWMIVGTILSWSAWALIITTTLPNSAGSLGLFYLSLALAAFGTFALLGFGWRALLSRNQLAYKQVAASWRQGCLLGVLVVVSLWLQSQDLLTWWTVLGLIFFLTALEFFLLSYET